MLVRREQQVKQLNYAGASRILTSDAIADAVIRYAAALHQCRLSDVVSIPTTDRYGQATRVEVLLAPGIAMAVEPEVDHELEVEDVDLLRELNRRTRTALAFTPPNAPTPSAPTRAAGLGHRMLHAVNVMRSGRRRRG